jgi:hypothetical protein
MFGFWQKDQAEKQTRLAVNAERNAKQQLEEAARSDRLVAEEKLQDGKDAEALAHLARAAHYLPKSSLPAEIASSEVLSPPIARSMATLATFQGHTAAVVSAVFSPDGRRVLTASRDYSARLWPVLLVGVPPPDWCSDFLVWLGGKRIAPDGQIETLSGDELLKLEARLRPHMNEDNDYARLLRWRLLKAEDRPIDPYDTTTQEQAADLIIRPDMNEYEAEHAYDLDPGHPLVQLALAGFEEDPIRADFLRRYSLDRLPNDSKLRQRAAEFLRNQGKEDLARKVEVRGKE